MTKLEREKRRLARAVDRERLKRVKRELRELRGGRRGRMRSIREACKVARVRLRERVKELRAETRLALREKILAMRSAERGTCQVSLANARTELEQAIGKAQGELGALADDYRREYGRRGTVSRTSAKERREESDDEVRRNLPPELAEVWQRVKRDIRPSSRRSRTEAFLEWVQDNPDEAHAIIYDQAERDIARLVAEHNEISRRQRGRYAGTHADQTFGAVPF